MYSETLYIYLICLSRDVLCEVCYSFQTEHTTYCNETSKNVFAHMFVITDHKAKLSGSSE